MEQETTIFRRTLRLPQDAAVFVAEEAKRNLTSENAEIVRSIRERMKAAGEEIGVTAPAATNNTALAGGVSSTQG